ncbi:CPXCG motif-containing cysteine-rich protein [Hydrogenimonas sp.]
MIEYFFVCPWCWQRISVLIDGSLTRFQGIEDCEVCCNPIAFDIRIEEGEVVAFRAEKAQ